MGMNFYLKSADPCPTCGHQEPFQHIGKSSAGWAFSLHVDDKFHGLDDYRREWSKPEAVIVDENGAHVPVDVMEDRITKRSHPRGLSRRPIDGRHCIGHGEGTWDLITGEFS